MLYTVLMASRKLRYYFQAHRVTVVTSYPLGHILRNQEGTERTVKWAIKLAKFGLQFAPRHSIRSQSLADFVVDGPRSLTSSARKKPRTWRSAMTSHGPWSTGV
jgi:hypothetical protein